MHKSIEVGERDSFVRRQCKYDRTPDFSGRAVYGDVSEHYGSQIDRLLVPKLDVAYRGCVVLSRETPAVHVDGRPR